MVTSETNLGYYVCMHVCLIHLKKKLPCGLKLDVYTSEGKEFYLHAYIPIFFLIQTFNLI